jgi:alanine-synthesizing transaminase
VNLSRRTDWPLQKNRLAHLLEQKQREGARVLDLTESNPTRAGFDYPSEQILGALSQPASLCYEPDPRGHAAARQAICRYYEQRGAGIDERQLVLTCSTSEAYAHLFRSLGDPGDNFLIPNPSYPLFEYLASLESVQLHPYRLAYQEGRWQMDLDSLREAMDSSTRAVLLVNPNNPTGSYIKGAELSALREICLHYGLPLIVDEVFSDYRLTDDPELVPSLVAEREVPVFVLNGLSKISGLPQMKLAWIVAAGPEKPREMALERLELIADTFLSVGTPVQAAAAVLLETGQRLQPLILERLQGNLNILRRELEATAADILPVEGGWYAVVRVPRIRAEEEWVLTLLDRHNVLAHPGYFFDFPEEAYLVFSLLTTSTAFEEGIRHFHALLES